MTTSLIILISILSDFQGLPSYDNVTIAPICRRLDDFIRIEQRNGTNSKTWTECRKNKDCLKLDDLSDGFYDKCEI